MDHGASLRYAAYGAAIGGHKDYAEDLRIRCQELGLTRTNTWIARGAVRGGHKHYARQFLGLAYPEFVCEDAARGGHKIHDPWMDEDDEARSAGRGGYTGYADKLIKRDPGLLREVCYGAAMCGLKGYTNKLIEDGANIDWAAKAAAKGGYINYAEELIGRGVDISHAAGYAASAGHKDYAQELRERGSNIDKAAEAAALGGHILKNNESSHLCLASFFSRKWIPGLVAKFNSTYGIGITVATRDRAIRMSGAMLNRGLSYNLAVTMTNPSFNHRSGFFFLLMHIAGGINTCITRVPNEHWKLIFNFLTPAVLNTKQFNHLLEAMRPRSSSSSSSSSSWYAPSILDT